MLGLGHLFWTFSFLIVHNNVIKNQKMQSMLITLAKNFKQRVWTSHFINVYCMCTTITRCGFWGSEKFLVIQTTLQYKLQLLDRFSLFHRLSSHRKKEKPIITTITLVLLVLWHPNKVQWKENHKILTALHYKLLYNINRSEPRLIMAHVRCRVYFEFLFRINSL